jgi:hypothetical protein
MNGKNLRPGCPEQLVELCARLVNRISSGTVKISITEGIGLAL